MKKNHARVWISGFVFLGGLYLGSAVGGAPAVSAHRAPLRTASAASNQTITVYTAGPKGLAKDLAKAFERQTGIRVEMFQSTTGKILGRLEAERANPHADVVVLADWSAAQTLANEGLAAPFRPPGLNELIWKDPHDRYFAYSASALGITYNTRLVKTPPADWTSAASPVWKGKAVMPDPSLSGSAVDFVGGYLQTQKNGWRLFRSLKANGLIVQGPNADALNQVLIGARSFVLAGVDYMAYAARKKGEPINIVYPKSGTVVNPRPVLVMKGSHHLKAAEEFADFLLSKSGQKIVAKEFLLPGRKDVPASPLRASLKQIHSWKVNWQALAAHKKQVLSQFDALFNGQ